MEGSGRLPGILWQNRQHQEASGKKARMDADLIAGREFPRQQMSIKISKQEHHLKEHQADDPNAGSATKPGEDQFSKDRLHLE